jgi:hypothetical protein
MIAIKTGWALAIHLVLLDGEHIKNGSHIKTGSSGRRDLRAKVDLAGVAVTSFGFAH